MKFISVLVLSVLAYPVFATNPFDALERNQNSLPAEQPARPENRPPSGVTTPTTRPTEVDTRCDEDVQTSLPLKYFGRLIRMQYPPTINVTPSPSTGRVTISSPAKMVGNCNSMLEWNLRTNEIAGEKTYAVEIKFKEGQTCPPEVQNAGSNKCFRVAKMKDGTFDKFEMKPFSNDFRGFQSCIEQSGVVKADGTIDESAIFKQPVNETFSGLEETGKFVFVSHGPVSSQSDQPFGLDRVNKCDVYEKINPTFDRVLSVSDIQNRDMQAQADALRNCQPNEYQRLVDFIERNNYVGDLNAIRDNLIKQAAQAAAKKIADGNETDEDVKVIADFERYIIEPLRLEIGDLYNQLQSASDADKPGILARLNQKKLELQGYARSPFFQRAHVEKLIAKGRFDDAEKLEGIRITVAEASKINNRNGNQTVTPDQARVAIATARGELTNNMATERENYDIRHGTITDRSATYRSLAQGIRNNIQRRTQNYTREIQAEYQRMQQGGYCYQYFRNTQKCLQDSQQRIQELYTAMNQYNNTDNQRAQEYDQRAQEYGAMEAEGRRNVAAANGQPAPTEAPQDTTVVPQRAPDTQTGNGQMQMGQQGGIGANPLMGQMMGQQGMMGMPGMMQQPYNMQQMMMMQQNPYASMYGQQQNPMMGQQGFNANFGFQGTMGQNFMGMPQQQYGSVGMNWFGMGQQMGTQMMGGQQMYNPMMMNGMSMQSPYGQMYGQSPYMQNGMMGGGMMTMPGAYNYPRFY